MRQRAKAKIADIESKIRSLQKMKKALEKLTFSVRRSTATGAGMPLVARTRPAKRNGREGGSTETNHGVLQDVLHFDLSHEKE